MHKHRWWVYRYFFVYPFFLNFVQEIYVVFVIKIIMIIIIIKLEVEEVSLGL